MKAKELMKDRILVNHVGFLPRSNKTFVIANPPATEFAINSDLWGDVIVYRGQLKRVNAELGDAWIGDFSSVQEEGVYLIHCGNLTSRPVLIHKEVYHQPLRTLFNYYPTQRCGDSLTGWHAPCHLDDACCAATGKHLDLVGGWHQSGDLRKWMTGTPYGLSGLAQLGILHHPRWDQGQIADELRWGNQYFHKMIRPDGGLMDHVICPNEWSGRKVYPNDPPTCATYLVIVGQALAARYLEERDPEHSRKCLEAARRMWGYITGPSCRDGGIYRPAVLPAGHDWVTECFAAHYCGSALERGDALYAALKLFEVTGDKAFLDQACSFANELVAFQVGGNIEDDPAAACFRVGAGKNDLVAPGYFGTAGSVFSAMGLAELAILRPEHPDAPRWRHAVELIAEQKCRMAERNPWGLIPSFWYSDKPGAGRPGGSGRYRYFFYFRAKNGGEIRLGPNGDIAGGALFLLRAYRLTGEPRYLATAQRQVNWIFGCNPFDASTVEGVGFNQPVRFIGGEFFPPTPQVPGAVMTGVIGDDDDNPVPFANNCSTEYDIPASAPLIWLLSELAAESSGRELGLNHVSV